MKIKIYFSEIACIRDGVETSIIDFQPSKFPPIVVEVKNLAQFTPLRDEYIKQAQASGLCGRIWTQKLSGRAFPGFLQLDQPLVNRHVGEASPNV